MRTAISALTLMILLSSAAQAQGRFGETCRGTEKVQVGAAAPRTAPYTITFSADLASGYYCYAACTRDQTYAIKDHGSARIKLADLQSDSQTREIIFDRKTGILTDFQVIRMLGTTTRHAEAHCKPSAFHQPPMLGNP